VQAEFTIAGLPEIQYEEKATGVFISEMKTGTLLI